MLPELRLSSGGADTTPSSLYVVFTDFPDLLILRQASVDYTHTMNFTVSMDRTSLSQ